MVSSTHSPWPSAGICHVWAVTSSLIAPVYVPPQVRRAVAGSEPVSWLAPTVAADAALAGEDQGHRRDDRHHHQPGQDGQARAGQEAARTRRRDGFRRSRAERRGLVRGLGARDGRGGRGRRLRDDRRLCLARGGGFGLDRRFLGLRGELLDLGDQAFHVAPEIGVVADDGRVAIGQLLEVGRQVDRAGHGRAVDQHRHDQDVLTAQPGGDLDAHEVVGVFQAALTRRIEGGHPGLPDDRQQHVAAGHLPLQGSAEVRPQRDVVHVLEDVLVTKGVQQVIVNAAGDGYAVSAAVGDEHARHRQAPLNWVI